MPAATHGPIQTESHQSKCDSRTLPFLQRQTVIAFQNTGLRSESLFASAAQREFPFAAGKQVVCFLQKRLCRASQEFSSARPSKSSAFRFCLKIIVGRSSHAIFYLILLCILNQNSSLVILSRYLCVTALYFAIYCAGPSGPSFIVQNWYRRHPAQMLYQSFPAPAQGHTEFCRLAHFPQAANRRLSLPKVSAAAALLQTVHCVCSLKLSTSRTRGPAQ